MKALKEGIYKQKGGFHQSELKEKMLMHLLKIKIREL